MFDYIQVYNDKQNNMINIYINSHDYTNSIIP